jgi:general stress protein 26
MVQVGIAINDFVKELLEKPCFGFVAGLDEAGHPEMSRCFGFNYDTEQNTLTVYTFKKDFQKMQDHLSAGDKISVALSNAQNFKTIQFKGTLNRIYDTPEHEMTYPRSCNTMQADIMASWGVPNQVFANWSFEQSVTVVMDVNEMFDQTPRPKAGEKIN